MAEINEEHQLWKLREAVDDVSKLLEPLNLVDRLRVVRAVSILLDIPMEETASPQQSDSYEQKTGH